MVLFLRYKNRFCYILDNESEQDILGWNKSCDKQSSQHVNDESDVVYWWHKVVTQEPIWNNQVYTVLTNNIQGETKVTQWKVTWLSRYWFGNIINRGVKSINDRLFTEGTRWMYRGF